MADDPIFVTDRLGRRRIRAGIIVPGRLCCPAGPVIVGLAIIALGVLFTLDNLGVVRAGEVLRWWPALLVLYGLARLTGLLCYRSVAIGSFFAVGGGLLLLHEAHLIQVDPWDLWPVLLIIIGATMVSRAVRRARAGADAAGPAGRVAGAAAAGESAAGAPATGPLGSSESAAGDSSSRFHSFALLSKLERKILSQDFRHGEVTVLLAGQSLDLRGARLAGGTATLDLVVIWGGVDLIVPADWKVSVETLTVLGGFEDASRAPMGEARGHLILRGLVFMGGVEVKN